MTLTKGNWIAYQNESQKRPNHDGTPRWTVALEHHSKMCHGLGPDGAYMAVSGICSEADARAMAAAKELLEACVAGEDFIATIDSEAARGIYVQLHAAIAKARGQA
jgi:hypothetical protein